jgi:putative transposase
MPIDILLFITWRVNEGHPLIDEALANELKRLLPRLALTESARVIELAIVSTHVHTVMRTNRSPDLPRLVQRLKGASSRLINRDQPHLAGLHWDRGYDARSIGRRSLDAVRRYFDSQARKHGVKWVVRYSCPQDAPFLPHAESALSAE